MEIDVIEQGIQDISPKLMKLLLIDKTTKGYIRWCSDNYADFGPEYQPDQEMRPELVTGNNTTLIQPRVSKSEKEKVKRTREKAEVFTPLWICNEQINLVDAAWFGRSDVFNQMGDKEWTTIMDPVIFPKDKIWKDYVDARRMEVSCGEAPYLVSRYDTVSGVFIEVENRIGLLDRKLRVVNENADTDDEWMRWTIRAFQSCYGYDYSGDNVLLARENLLYTFIDHFQSHLGRTPSLKELKKIANVIAWNVWQMNGLTMTVPFSKAEPSYRQMSIYDLFEIDKNEDEKDNVITTDEIPCRIFDWRQNGSIEFRSMVRESKEG